MYVTAGLCTLLGGRHGAEQGQQVRVAVLHSPRVRVGPQLVDSISACFRAEEEGNLRGESR